MSGNPTLGRVFRWPVALAVLTVAGLLSALVGDGVWDSLSWLLLAVPAATGAILGWRRR